MRTTPVSRVALIVTILTAFLFVMFAVLWALGVKEWNAHDFFGLTAIVAGAVTTTNLLVAIVRKGY